MTDLYLKADSQEALDGMMLSIGLIDEDSNPAEGVDLDRIGTISRITGFDAGGEPIVKTYDGYHANVRTAFELSGRALTIIEPFAVEPPETLFRVWG
jgi:hypothetical protein